MQSGTCMYGLKLQSSLSVHANTLFYLPLSGGYREQDTQTHRHISTRLLHGVILQTLGILSSFEFFALNLDIPSNVDILYSGTQSNIPEERSHFPVLNIISDMLVPVLCSMDCT